MFSRKGSAASSGKSVSGASAISDAQLKSNLNKILGSREFQADTNKNNPLKDLMLEGRRAWDRFRKWWDHLFGSAGLQAGSSIIIYVLLALILTGLIWVVVRMFRDWSPRETAARSNPLLAAEDEAQAEIERNPSIWMKQAEEWASQADYRRAFRAVFFAMLLELDSAGALSYDRARTNGDYLHQLQQARNQPLYDLLAALASAFDARWYGEQATSAQDYQEIRAAHQHLPSLHQSFTRIAAANAQEHADYSAIRKADQL